MAKTQFNSLFSVTEVPKLFVPLFLIHRCFTKHSLMFRRWIIVVFSTELGRLKILKNIENTEGTLMQHRRIIKVHNVWRRFDASLMLLMKTLINHWCDQCILDWDSIWEFDVEIRPFSAEIIIRKFFGPIFCPKLCHDQKRTKRRE